MQARVLVLGAGFGGLELATVLSAELGDGLDLTLIDRNASFAFGYSKLDVMFGRAAPESVQLHYGDIAKTGVRVLQETVTAIDPDSRRVTTDAGVHEGDFLVVALGADYDVAATPGLAEAGHEFYSFAGAQRARDVLSGFDRGHVVISVCGAPYKCPPAPSECALLLDELLTVRGVRGDCAISLVLPSPIPVTSSQEASRALLAAFAERGIEFVPGRRTTRLDAGRRTAILDDGAEIAFDLFLGVPRHCPPPVAAAAGLAEDGYVKVDPATLQTRYERVYAIGDVTSMTVPKAGSFAEGQARTVAASIVAAVRGGEPAAPYVGLGSCFLEFGHGQVARVDVDFSAGPPPVGVFDGPSSAVAAGKHDFGASRADRWFGSRLPVTR